jgi:hypothetical protein
VDVILSEHRDLAAAKAFFRSAKVAAWVTPDRVAHRRLGDHPGVPAAYIIHPEIGLPPARSPAGSPTRSERVIPAKALRIRDHPDQAVVRVVSPVIVAIRRRLLCRSPGLKASIQIRSAKGICVQIGKNDATLGGVTPLNGPTALVIEQFGLWSGPILPGRPTARELGRQLDLRSSEARPNLSLVTN